MDYTFCSTHVSLEMYNTRVVLMVTSVTVMLAALIDGIQTSCLLLPYSVYWAYDYIQYQKFLNIQ